MGTTFSSEGFDREKYWLLATCSRVVKSPTDPERETMEYELFWCHVPRGEVFHAGRTDVREIYDMDCWPGASWTYAELLERLDTIEEQPSLATLVGRAKRIWRDLGLAWFRPILEDLAAGKAVSYDEVNEAHMAAHEGKPLRLYFFSPVRDEEEEWMMTMEYDY